MNQSVHPETRNFFCDHCGGEIGIPYDLPPTAAPCPFCGTEVMSPPPPLPVAPVTAPAVVEESPVVIQPVAPLAEAVTVEAAPVVSPVVAERIAEAPTVETPTVKLPVPVDLPEPAVQGGKRELPSATGPGQAVGEPVLLKDRAAPDEGEEALREAKKAEGMMPAVLFFLAVLALAALVALGVSYLLPPKKTGVSVPSGRQAEDTRFILDGWMGVATERLRSFLNADTLEEKAKNVIGGVERLEEMRGFYAKLPLDESDTPLDAFSHHQLELQDRENGVFLMRYERPAQFDMREFFRPVAPLEVQYGVEEPGSLLSSVAALENFAMEPVHVMALFKRMGNDLFVDWDVYVQTKYRTFREFVNRPVPGARKVFRVLAQEEIPSTSPGGGTERRSYRLTDPANQEDSVQVEVETGSEAGKVLSQLNWIGVAATEVPVRTATVELVWGGADGSELELARVLCWQFLGVGGVEGNTALPEPAPAGGGTEEDGSEPAAP